MEVYRCGHEFKGFTTVSAEVREEQKQRDCPDCIVDLKNYGFYPIRQDELIELQGSEKQVAWAVKIRKDFLDTANNRIKDGKRRGATDEDVAKMRRIFISIFNRQDHAKFWIDHRSDTLKIFDPAWQEALANENS